VQSKPGVPLESARVTPESTLHIVVFEKLIAIGTRATNVARVTARNHRCLDSHGKAGCACLRLMQAAIRRRRQREFDIEIATYITLFARGVSLSLGCPLLQKWMLQLGGASMVWVVVIESIQVSRSYGGAVAEKVPFCISI